MSGIVMMDVKQIAALLHTNKKTSSSRELDNSNQEPLVEVTTDPNPPKFPTKVPRNVEEETRLTQAEEVTTLDATTSATNNKENADNNIVYVADKDTDGVSESKRSRRNDDDLMDVDEIREVVKSAKSSMRTISRQELEDSILSKIVEAIASKSEIGHLKAKCGKLQIQREEMQKKMGIMSRQIAELSAAINSITESQKTCQPQNQVSKPPPIRFTRSVGIQTSDPGVDQYVPGRVPTTETLMGPPLPPAKRGDQCSGNKTNGGLQNLPNTSFRSGPAWATSAQLLPTSRVHLTPSISISPVKVEPRIVDLTDDDDDDAESATKAKDNNGIDCRIAERPGTSSGGMQLVSTGAPSGSSRNQRPFSATQQRQVAHSGTGGNSPLAKSPTPTLNKMIPMTNLVAAAVTIRPVTCNNARTRFSLPPLPVTPPPKAKCASLTFPTKPDLTVQKNQEGIILSWNLPIPAVGKMAKVSTFQVYATHEPLKTPITIASSWKKVGDVKALELPMACTLSQFKNGYRYYLILRGVDVYGRTGPFCDPQSIELE